MSEDKENKVSKSFVDNKLSRYGVTKKTAYSVGGMLICIFLIIVLSVTQAQFDTSLIATVNFWIDFTILAGLCIYGMISGQQTGDDMARNNPNGAFRSSLKRFSTSFTRLDNLMLFAYFDEWLDWYRERKLKKKIEGVLKDNGIHQMDVLKLDLSELDSLKEPFKKEWIDGKVTYFLTYTEEQIGIIKYCMTGNVKVSKLPRTFFVDAFYHSEKDMWESAAKSTQKKTAYLSINYIYRIIALLVISILSAGLVPGADGEGGSGASVWLALAKRIFCVTTAFLWGIFIGFELVKIDISYLDFKTDVLNLYYQECELNIYTPNSLEEKARKIYEENQVHKKMMEEEENGRERNNNSGTKENEDESLYR